MTQNKKIIEKVLKEAIEKALDKNFNDLNFHIDLPEEIGELMNDLFTVIEQAKISD